MFARCQWDAKFAQSGLGDNISYYKSSLAALRPSKWSGYAITWPFTLFQQVFSCPQSTPTEESMDLRTQKGWKYHEQTKACHNYKYISDSILEH